MKKILPGLFSLIVALTVLSCNKEPLPISDSLTGTWEMHIDVNGMTGKPTYHKPGNDTLIKFTDKTYAYYQKDKLIRSGTYLVKKDTFLIGQTIKNRIIYDNQINNSIAEFIEIKNNQLTFFIDADDAPSVTYQRIK